MPGKIRAFIAIDLPGAVAAAVAGVQKQLAVHRFAVRWVNPRTIHLTLKFLGDIDGGQVAAVGDAMETAARSVGPFSLAAAGLGVFPGLRQPRVIWAGVVGDTQRLLELQRAVAVQLAAAGYPPESRPFKSHLTIGRVKDRIDAQRLARSLADAGGFATPSFTVEGIVLYRSDLRPGGPEYTPLRRVPIRPHAS
jgi:2'-5' RNA ligase